jgi:hypothetical protein
MDVDEVDGEYEDELEEDEVRITNILFVGHNAECKQEHVGGSRESAAASGSRPKATPKPRAKVCSSHHHSLYSFYSHLGKTPKCTLRPLSASQRPF